MAGAEAETAGPSQSDDALTVSVAMGAYNGARFLREQLDSLLRQTHLPCELVVCDDGSTDSTVDILESFALESPFPVRIIRNDENLGPARNFGKVIGLCSGDLIALADQDDVWLPEKIRATVHAFASDAGLALVFTNGEIVDAELAPLGVKLSESGFITEQVQQTLRGPGAFAYLLRRNVATGATMAFRSSLRGLILPIPEVIATYHDAWIVQIAAATARVQFLPEPLLLYRQHPSQQTYDFVVNGPKKLQADHYAAHLRQLEAMRGRLTAASASLDPLALIDGYITHLRRRSTLPALRPARIGPVVAELMSGRYAQYSSGWRSALRDVVG